MCTEHYLTIIHYIDWDNFVSRRDGTSITASAETDVKMFCWFKHEVILNVNAHWYAGNGISECKCFCKFGVVLWI